MASYKEIIALGRDPVRVRAVAHRLLASAEDCALMAHSGLFERLAACPLWVVKQTSRQQFNQCLVYEYTP